MNAPLYQTLKTLSRQDNLRLHMPGHKGRSAGAFRAVASIDYTELAPTGNLYTGEGPIAPAEDLCALAAGAADALFFSCGSTQGIFTMLAAAVGMGGTLILDRGCHKSVWHGMALLDITPHYLPQRPLGRAALPMPVSPETLKTALTQCPEARAVLLTSPSYYGVITSLAPLAALCRSRGVLLLVDQAHGAHFPFVGLPSAVREGADLAVSSAHKTWPALGSSAILYRSAACPISKARLKALSAVFATSSPSYPILASIDYARAGLEGRDGRRYRAAAGLVKKLRADIDRLTPFHALSETDGIALDPCRLTVDTLRGGIPGWEAEALLRRMGIYLETADMRYLVAIFTCGDRPSGFRRLLRALMALQDLSASRKSRDAAGGCASGTAGPEEFPPPPVFRIPVRQALFGPRETLPLRDAAGRIAAEVIAPCPPGIPAVAPGEEILQKHIAYLEKTRYNIDGMVSVCRPGAAGDAVRRESDSHFRGG